MTAASMALIAVESVKRDPGGLICISPLDIVAWPCSRRPILVVAISG